MSRPVYARYQGEYEVLDNLAAVAFEMGLRDLIEKGRITESNLKDIAVVAYGSASEAVRQRKISIDKILKERASEDSDPGSVSSRKEQS